jgi:AmiR/NasT family two-component response regulator
MRRLAPTFGGLRAVVLHGLDESVERLVRQLELLGLRVDVRWSPLEAGEPLDIAIVDADQGFDELLPWPGADTPVPLIGLLRSEAPGRIAWMLERGVSAFIPKPVQTSAIYPALVVATTIHAERQEARTRVQNLEERLRMRPIVYEAMRIVACTHSLDQDGAYRHLRELAMKSRKPVEQVAAAIVATGRTMPEAG